jgi:hypothetical protein
LPLVRRSMLLHFSTLIPWFQALMAVNQGKLRFYYSTQNFTGTIQTASPCFRIRPRRLTFWIWAFHARTQSLELAFLINNFTFSLRRYTSILPPNNLFNTINLLVMFCWLGDNKRFPDI